MTGLAGSHPHESLIFLFDRIGSRLPIAAFHIFDQTFECYIVDSAPPLSGIIHFHLFSVGSMDNNIMDLFRIILERRIQRKIIFSGKRVKNRAGIAALIGTGLPAQHNDRSLCNTQRRVRNHQLLIKFHLIPQPITTGAGAEWVVERKAARFDFIHTDLTIRTGKTLAEA